GILVWGVDARKGDDGIDCAQNLSPIADLERFAYEAQTLVGQLLIPRHDGIKLETVPSDTEKGSGYLVVFIERSERRPHRCEASGEKQYYKRAGDNTFAMEHYDIEDAFKRAGSPVIQFEVSMSFGKLDKEELAQEILQLMPIYYHIFMKNTGTAIAKHLYMAVDNLSNFTIYGLLNGRRSPLSQVFRMVNTPITSARRSWYCTQGCEWKFLD
ncbi:MAG: AlbA family DNA-binding domain-containing protein, partial [Janthinobacterium lividum]